METDPLQQLRDVHLPADPAGSMTSAPRTNTAERGGVGGGASASAQRDLMEKLLYDEKRKAPSKIPYFLSPSKELPGKFMLSYLPRKSTRHEFVTVTPEGLRYRQQIFHSLGAMVRVCVNVSGLCV